MGFLAVAAEIMIFQAPFNQYKSSVTSATRLKTHVIIILRF